MFPRRYTGPTPETVALVLSRCSGCCEVCSDALVGERGIHWGLHHRRGRDGRSDSHSVQNLMAVHGASNVDGCHGLIHSRRSEAQPNGWWLSRNARPIPDPLTVPVLIERGARVVYFTADGRYAETLEVAA